MKPAIVEHYEVELAPRLPHRLWEVEQVHMKADTTVRDALLEVSAARNVDFLVAGESGHGVHCCCCCCCAVVSSPKPHGHVYTVWQATTIRGPGKSRPRSSTASTTQRCGLG